MKGWIEIGAVLVCYIVITLPLAGASNVNIMQNGVVKKTVEYTPENVVNQMINYKRDASDITWRDVKIHVTINSASLSQSIKKIYMYKCKTMSPSSCIQKTPETFDNYLDTEIAWKDISESIGASTYPQGGNLLFLVMLEDSEGVASWVGIWNNIKRTSTKEFVFSRYEVPEINVHASSIHYVEPIRAYIENFNMIPFKWVNKIVFGNTDSLFVLGSSDDDLAASTPVFSAVEPQTNEIDSIGKKYHFAFPVTASGIAVPVTLNENPTFTCGDGNCQSNIGENSVSCCYDCGCEDDYYCNSPSQTPSEGTCESEDQISLSVRSVPMVDVTDCGVPATLVIPIEINNPPANLPDSLRGTVKLGSSTYTVTCTGEDKPNYECPVRLDSDRGCGKTTELIEENSVSVTLTYSDGPSQTTKTISRTFSQAKVNYDCDCGEGKYCDTGSNTCKSEEAITIGITSLTSYLDEYTPGDTINLKAKVFNPPTGLVLVSSSAYLNLTNGIVSPGSPSCSLTDENEYVYDCSIPFSITAYSKQTNYKFEPNTLIFEVTYNDGPTAKTKTLQTGFGPISIPLQDCGDGKVDPGETPETCCLDAGCNSPDEYCDEVKGCQLIENIGLRATVYPTEFEDCTEDHGMRITTEVINAPARLSPKDYVFVTNGMVTPWSVDKADRTLGIYEFLVTIPKLEGGCELPYYSLQNNSVRLTIEFPNGHSTMEKDLNATIDNIYITPKFHPGNGICEVNILENASNSCVDCPCGQDENYGEDYYCSYDRDTYYGTCVPKSNMSLMITSPTSPVVFDSCEKTNYVMILGYIENAPDQGFRIGSTYASMNGESVNVRRCREVENYNETVFELNCSIAIPPDSKCSQGKTTKYTGNTFSLILTYPDGQGNKAIQTLTSPFANVQVTQSIKSMYDIMEENKAKMEESLDEIIEIADEMVDAVTECMEMMIMMMVLSTVLTIAMAFVGGFGWGSGSDAAVGDIVDTAPGGLAAPAYGGTAVSAGGSGFDFDRALDFAKLGASIGDSAQQGIQAMCKTIQAQLQIAMEMEKVKMDQVAMHTCLEIIQHQMDTGACAGQESSCFNSMQSCIKDGVSDISSSMKEVGNILDDVGEEYGGIFESIEEIEDIWDDDWGDEYVQVSVYHNGRWVTIGNGAAICAYKNKNANDYTGGVRIRKESSSSCKYLVIRTSGVSGLDPADPSYNTINSFLRIPTTFSRDSTTTRSYAYTVDFYCTRDRSTYNLQHVRSMTINYYIPPSSTPPNAPDTWKTNMCEYSGITGGFGYGVLNAGDALSMGLGTSGVTTATTTGGAVTSGTGTSTCGSGNSPISGVSSGLWSKFSCAYGIQESQQYCILGVGDIFVNYVYSNSRSYCENFCIAGYCGDSSYCCVGRNNLLTGCTTSGKTGICEIPSNLDSSYTCVSDSECDGDFKCCYASADNYL